MPSAAASISTAVQRLYEDIQASTKLIRDQRMSSNTQFDVATLDTYLNDALRALAKDYRSSLDFHRLAAGVALRPKLFSEHLAAVMANLARTRGLDETNEVGGEQDVADDMARFVGASIAVQLPWGGVEGKTLLPCSCVFKDVLIRIRRNARAERVLGSGSSPRL